MIFPEVLSDSIKKKKKITRKSDVSFEDDKSVDVGHETEVSHNMVRLFSN